MTNGLYKMICIEYAQANTILKKLQLLRTECKHLNKLLYGPLNLGT